MLKICEYSLAAHSAGPASANEWLPNLLDKRSCDNKVGLRRRAIFNELCSTMDNNSKKRVDTGRP